MGAESDSRGYARLKPISQKKLFYEYLPSAFSEVFPAHVLKITEVIFKKGGGGGGGGEYFVKSQARYSQGF